MSLTITLRRRFDIDRGLRVVIDDAFAIESGQLGRCELGECLAVFDVEPDFVDRMKHGRVLFVEASDREGRTVRFGFSLAGFAEAYDPPPVPPDVRAERERSARAQLAEMMRRAQEMTPEERAKARECLRD